MSEFGAIALLILAGAAALTIAALAARAWFQPERRVRRALLRSVGAKGDAEIVAGDCGAAFSLSQGVLAVAWGAGRWRVGYAMDDVLGGEVLVDDEVAARVFRGETRRALDRIAPDASSVSLRLVFADPSQPDFEMSLWPAARSAQRAPANAGAAIREANTWLARTEALLRRPLAAPVIRAEAAAYRPGEPEGV